MELKILNEKNNVLFSRKELELETESNSTPSKAETEEAVSKKFSTTPESIVIKKISNRFGSQKFQINVLVYSSPEEKNKIERKPKEKKK